MQTNTTSLIRPVLVALTFVFTATALFSPTVHAADNTLIVGGSREDCVAKQSSNPDPAALKKYGQARVANREKSLARYQDSTLNKKYEALEKQFASAKKSADKKTGKNLAISKPESHKQTLINERNAIAANLQSKKQVIESSVVPAELAEANCSIIWDLRISSFVAPKFSYQYTLDTYAYKNAINKALFQVAKDKNKTAGIKDPSELDKRIAAQQTVLEGITINSAKPTDTTKFNPLGAAGKEVFAQKLSDTKAIKKEISESSTKLKSATREATKQKKVEKKQTTSKPTSTGGGSDSGSSSSSDSSGSGSSNSNSSDSGSSSSTSSTTKSKGWKKPKDVAKWCIDNDLGRVKKDGANLACQEGAKKAWGSKNYSSDAGKACNVKKGKTSRVEVVYNWCAAGYQKAYKAKYGSSAKDSGFVANYGQKPKKAPKPKTTSLPTDPQQSQDAGTKRLTIAQACSTSRFKGIPKVITAAQQIDSCKAGYKSNGSMICNDIMDRKGRWTKWKGNTATAGFNACNYGNNALKPL